MRKKILGIVFAAALLAALAVPVFGGGAAFANPPTAACSGLDVAHEEIHASGTEGEFRLHDLRADNHCSH